jgi:hypothetical protein
LHHFSTLTEPEQTTIFFARVDCLVSLDQLQAEVERLLVLQPDWVDHVNNQDYRGHWDVFPLRCQQQHLHAHKILQSFSIAAGDDWQNLPVLDLCPALQSILNQLQCPIKSARLMRLHAGAEIKPHCDPGLNMESGEARLHLPIYTNDAVSFIVDQKKIPMCAGELWYFNADRIHEVYNHSNEDRINLVIDCVVNDWLSEKIKAGVM